MCHQAGHCFSWLAPQEDHPGSSMEHIPGPFVGGWKREQISMDSHWAKIYHRVFKLSHFFLGFRLNQNFNQQASEWDKRCKRGLGWDTVRMDLCEASWSPFRTWLLQWLRETGPEDRRWYMGAVIQQVTLFYYYFNQIILLFDSQFFISWPTFL